MKKMTKTRLLPEVQNVLERLHTLADARDETTIQQVRGNEAVWNTASSEQKAAMMQDALLPVSQDAGRFLYAVARSISAKRIVEFGTSFGVSTIYFAAAMKDNGGGLVNGSELEGSKVAKANQHLAEAGLSEFADVRPGDALQTLRDVGGTIDLLFLDGWKVMYLDVLKLADAKSSPRFGGFGGRRDPFPRRRGELFGFRPQSCQRIRDGYDPPWGRNRILGQAVRQTVNQDHVHRLARHPLECYDEMLQLKFEFRS